MVIWFAVSLGFKDEQSTACHIGSLGNTLWRDNWAFLVRCHQKWACRLGPSGLAIGLPLASIHRFPRNHNRNVRSGTRLSSVANAPGPNFSPFRCPPHGLGHTLLHSDHVECRNNDKLSEWSCVSIISTAKRLHNLTIKSNPKTNSLFLYHMQSLARFTCRPSNEITPELYNNSFQSNKGTA